MRQYNDLVNTVLDEGVWTNNRTGIDTISYFGYHYKHDLAEGYPLLTSKRVFLRGVIEELVWYLRGDPDIRYLQERGITFWDAWADQHGFVDSPYGYYWRRYPMGTGNGEYVDQVANIVKTLLTDPTSRRMILTAWDPRNAWESKLPPCHLLAAFNVKGGRLNCHLTQRSGDIALGVPFNLACYAALTHYLAAFTGYEPGIFSHLIVDAHIYENHISGLKEQISRPLRPLPTLTVEGSYPDPARPYVPSPDQFHLEGYDPHPHIPFEVAV